MRQSKLKSRESHTIFKSDSTSGAPPYSEWQVKERKFRAIIDLYPNATILTDAEGRITETNQATLEFFGYSSKELLGRCIWVLLSENHAFKELLVELQARGTLSKDLDMERKDGSRFSVYITVKALLMSQHSIETDTGYVWVFQDKSELRRTQSELEQAHKQLIKSREDERLYLARELHDGPLQSLIAMNFQVTTSLRAIKKLENPEALSRLRDLVEALRKDLRTTAMQLRKAVNGLRPDDLEAFGLIEGLENYIAKLEHTYGSKPEVCSSFDKKIEKLPQPIQLVLYRVCQETLSNAFKHAKASRINVTCSVNTARSEVQLLIEDDGQGFKIPEALDELKQKDHFGLAGIDERVELVGGKLKLFSQLNMGTEVVVYIPVELKDS
ncbi:MAG: PAS domain S-box protein [Trueperaceae bacterium]|nr:PAS domain S-box protein [Trueperaceae bacterium]